MQALTTDQIRRLRMRSQRLHPRMAPDPIEPPRLVRDLCGIQAQEPRSAVMAVWTRGGGPRARDIEQALLHDRSIVRTWCMRGTIHLVATADLGWLLPLLGPDQVRKSARRYRELGMNESFCAAAIDALRDILAHHGPATRSELAQHLAENGFPTEGQATYHLVRRAGLEGVLCFGPDRDGEPTYVALADWVRSPSGHAEGHAVAALARRYLAAYGPAGLDDLVTWSGLTRSKARTALAMLDVDPAGSGANFI